MIHKEAWHIESSSLDREINQLVYLVENGQITPEEFTVRMVHLWGRWGKKSEAQIIYPSGKPVATQAWVKKHYPYLQAAIQEWENQGLPGWGLWVTSLHNLLNGDKHATTFKLYYWTRVHQRDLERALEEPDYGIELPEPLQSMTEKQISQTVRGLKDAVTALAEAYREYSERQS